MPTITSNGLDIAYDDHGSGEPAFVFVHGWTCDRSFFKPQAEHFGKQHRVITVDLRGHGESDRPGDGYSVANYASDLAELIKQLNTGKVIAVGHSMGGQTVLQLAADRPELVAGIVMVDPAPLSPPPEATEWLEGLVGATAAGNNEPRAGLIDSFFLPASDPQVHQRVKETMLASPNHIAAAAMQSVVDFDGPTVAGQCKVPALNIAAASPLNPPHMMQEWIPHVVNGQTVGAGHFNHLEAPVQVNAMIEAFLEHYV